MNLKKNSLLLGFLLASNLFFNLQAIFSDAPVSSNHKPILATVSAVPDDKKVSGDGFLDKLKKPLSDKIYGEKPTILSWNLLSDQRFGKNVKWLARICGINIKDQEFKNFLQELNAKRLKKRAAEFKKIAEDSSADIIVTQQNDDTKDAAKYLTAEYKRIFFSSKGKDREDGFVVYLKKGSKLKLEKHADNKAFLIATVKKADDELFKLATVDLTWPKKKAIAKQHKKLFSSRTGLGSDDAAVILGTIQLKPSDLETLCTIRGLKNHSPKKASTNNLFGANKLFNHCLTKNLIPNETTLVKDYKNADLFKWVADELKVKYPARSGSIHNWQNSSSKYRETLYKITKSGKKAAKEKHKSAKKHKKAKKRRSEAAATIPEDADDDAPVAAGAAAPEPAILLAAAKRLAASGDNKSRLFIRKDFPNLFTEQILDLGKLLIKMPESEFKKLDLKGRIGHLDKIPNFWENAGLQHDEKKAVQEFAKTGSTNFDFLAKSCFRIYNQDEASRHFESKAKPKSLKFTILVGADIQLLLRDNPELFENAAIQSASRHSSFEGGADGLKKGTIMAYQGHAVQGETVATMLAYASFYRKHILERVLHELAKSSDPILKTKYEQFKKGIFLSKDKKQIASETKLALQKPSMVAFQARKNTDKDDRPSDPKTRSFAPLARLEKPIKCAQLISFAIHLDPESKDIEKNSNAHLLLAQQMVGAIRMAHINDYKKVFLTGLGIGAFNNDEEWFANALGEALTVAKETNLDVYLVIKKAEPTKFDHYNQKDGLLDLCVKAARDAEVTPVVKDLQTLPKKEISSSPIVPNDQIGTARVAAAAPRRSPAAAAAILPAAILHAAAIKIEKPKFGSDHRPIMAEIKVVGRTKPIKLMSFNLLSTNCLHNNITAWGKALGIDTGSEPFATLRGQTRGARIEKLKQDLEKLVKEHKPDILLTQENWELDKDKNILTPTGYNKASWQRKTPSHGQVFYCSKKSGLFLKPIPLPTDRTGTNQFCSVDVQEYQKDKKGEFLLRLGNVHLSWGDRSDDDKVLEKIQPLFNTKNGFGDQTKPAVIMGDFNLDATDHKKSLEAIAEQGGFAISSPKENTAASPEGKKDECVDHLLYRWHRIVRTENVTALGDTTNLQAIGEWINRELAKKFPTQYAPWKAKSKTQQNQALQEAFKRLREEAVAARKAEYERKMAAAALRAAARRPRRK